MKNPTLCAGVALVICILVTASFSLGMAYQKFTAGFVSHQIPVVGGGTALVIPKEWNVVRAWNKFGRPHIDTDRECEKPTKKGETE